MKSVIDSPLAANSTAQLIKVIDANSVIQQYQKEFKIDVRSYFEAGSDIGVYKCLATSYQFYYPFDLGGDSLFYKKLQNFEGYYMPWKWEHQKVKELLKGNERILEVGSGDFGFVNRLHQENFDISGLELNEDSNAKAKQLNLKVINETIQEHAKSQVEGYDVVCSFQVLEHIAEVRSFVQAQLDCLKIGGKLIIAVPNNDSFIKLSGGGVLNRPPHHMGLWTETALKSIENVFDLKLEHIYFEPLQDYHVRWYFNSIKKYRLNSHKVIKRVLNSHKMKQLLFYAINRNQRNIKGHTMIAIYSKKQ